MELLEIVSSLNAKLVEYESKNQEANELLKQNIRQAKIAVLLVELGLINGLPISKENEFWFTGCYLMSYDFGGDIGDLYCLMVDKVEELDYFRKG